MNLVAGFNVTYEDGKFIGNSGLIGSGLYVVVGNLMGGVLMDDEYSFTLRRCTFQNLASSMIIFILHNVNYIFTNFIIKLQLQCFFWEWEKSR